MPDNDVTTMLEASVAKSVAEAFEKVSFQEMVDRKVEEMVKSAVDDACRWGRARDAVKKKVDELLVPAIESYDLGKCNVKLELLLDQLVEESAIGERRDILKNLKLLAASDTAPKETAFSDIVDAFERFVADDFDNSGREVQDGEYAPIECRYAIEAQKRHGYFEPLFEECVIAFEVIEEDDPNDCAPTMAKRVRLSRYRADRDWVIDAPRELSVTDLRCLDEFDTRIATMAICRTKFHDDLDERETTFEAEPTWQPELEYV